MNLYPNRHGTKINIGFTFNNKTAWFTHAPNNHRRVNAYALITM